jgi:hypothetical protein
VVVVFRRDGRGEFCDRRGLGITLRRASIGITILAIRISVGEPFVLCEDER